jgi:hypothetical protein
MTAPCYIKEDNAQEYLSGYRAQARKLFGDDWETCEFGWKKALLINGDEEVVDDG